MRAWSHPVCGAAAVLLVPAERLVDWQTALSARYQRESKHLKLRSALQLQRLLRRSTVANEWTIQWLDSNRTIAWLPWIRGTRRRRSHASPAAQDRCRPEHGA